MKETFIKSILTRALLPLAAREETEAALVNAHTPESQRTINKMRLGPVSAIALALVGVAALLVPAARATPQSGVTTVPIADGAFDEIDIFAKTDMNSGSATDYWKAMISTKGVSHLYVAQNTVMPGGTFGWHSHTGPTLVIVVSGTATGYEGDDSTCTPHVHPAGSTFVDAGHATGHLVRNEGSVNLVVTVVRLVPEGAVQRIDLPNPGYCPTLN